MKKKFISILLVVAMLATLVACGATNTGDETTETNTTVTETDSETISETTDTAVSETNTIVSGEDGEAIDEVVHEHEYVETVTTEATCTENGAVSYVCECGDTYDEEVDAKGHNFGEYVADGNASYTADGTKTAKCSSCEATDTVADEGSKLSYTYTDGEAVKYAQQTVNLRSGPSTDFDKIGSLSTNDEVKVVATCNETGWYKIVWNGSEAYVSNNYLGDKKVEPPAPADNGNSGGTAAASVPRAADYAPGVWHNMGTYSFYISDYYNKPYGPDGVMRSGGFHMNDGTDRWCYQDYTDPNDSALSQFIRANRCNCTDASHNGLYPFRLGN